MKKIRYLIILSMLFTLLMCGSVFASDFDVTLEWYKQNVTPNLSSNGLVKWYKDGVDGSWLRVRTDAFIFYLDDGFANDYKVIDIAQFPAYYDKVIEAGAGLTQTFYTASYDGNTYHFSIQSHDENPGYYNSVIISRNTLADRVPVFHTVQDAFIYAFFGSSPDITTPPNDVNNELGFVEGWGSEVIPQTTHYIGNLYTLNGILFGGIKLDKSLEGKEAFIQVAVSGKDAFAFTSAGISRLYTGFLDNGMYPCYIGISGDSFQTFPLQGQDFSKDFALGISQAGFAGGHSYTNGDYELTYSELLGLPSRPTFIANGKATFYARYIAKIDGEYIYGKWSACSFDISGINPKTTPFTVTTSRVGIDGSIDVTGANQNIEYDSNTAGDIINDLLNKDVDGDSYTSNAKNLIEIASYVPEALSDLFSFLPSWVLALFAVVFVTMLIIRLIR